MADTVKVEVNGDPQVKGPDPDRLENHSAEVRAHAKRLQKEAAEEQ